MSRRAVLYALALAPRVDALSLALPSVDAPKLRLGANAAGVRGLLATQPIKKGEPLITANAAVTLETTTLDAAKAPKALRTGGYCDDAAWKAAGWEGRLALLLLAAREDPGDRAAWLEALPKSYDDVPAAAWSDADVKDCGYAPLRELIETQRAKWQKVKRAVGASPKFSEADLDWALATVETRSFSGPLEASSPKQRLAVIGFAAWLAGGYVLGGFGDGETALQGFAAVAVATLLSDFFVSRNEDLKLERHVLAPGIDFLNHADYVDGGAAYEYFADAFAVGAARDYKEGDEVHASYGRKSNAQLLANYGFVVENNAHDDYVFPDQHPYPPLRGARVTRTGFDEKVAKAAVAHAGSQDQARSDLAAACRAQASALEASGSGGLAALCGEHAKILASLAEATDRSGL